jgi:hypothetical protein
MNAKGKEIDMHEKMKSVKIAAVLALCLSLGIGTGCATKGQTGALTGASAGALIGGLANMHGSWGATALLGAGIGAGVGYLIGNEEDKKDAQKRTQVTEQELKPLAGTTWQVVSVSPKPEKSYKSVIVHFRTDGNIVTTRTLMNGSVGSTLIIYKPDYVVNDKFSIEGNKLIIDYGNGTAVLHRVS